MLNLVIRLFEFDFRTILSTDTSNFIESMQDSTKYLFAW